MNGHALGANFAHQGFAQHRIEVRQQAILADELLHLAAEFLKGCGQLAGDVTAADHGDPLRPGLEVKKAVRADAEVCAGDLRQHRLAARRNHHMACAQALSVHLNGVRIHEAGRAANVRHALGRQIAFIDVVQPQYVGIALVLYFRPVVLAHFDVEAIVARVVQAQGDARRIPHDFLRDAPHVHTGPSQPIWFDNRRFGAELGRTLCAGEAAAAAADADEIKCLVGHGRIHPLAGLASANDTCSPVISPVAGSRRASARIDRWTIRFWNSAHCRTLGVSSRAMRVPPLKRCWSRIARASRN